MKKVSIFILVVVLFLGTSGCFKIYQDLRINADLSGSVTVKVVYDLDLMLDGIVSMQAGPDASPEMKEMMKEQMKEDMQNKMKQGMAMESQEQMREKMPEGIELTTLKVKTEKGKMQVKMKFSFEHVDRMKDLKDVKFAPKGQKSPMGMKNPMGDNPFKDLKFEVDGDYLTISQGLKNSPIKQNQQMKNMMPGMEKMMKQAMKSMATYFKIRIPKGYKVIEHSAHKFKKSKRTLYWRYSVESMQKMAKQGKQVRGIYVKLKKS